MICCISHSAAALVTEPQPRLISPSPLMIGLFVSDFVDAQKHCTYEHTTGSICRLLR